MPSFSAPIQRDINGGWKPIAPVMVADASQPQKASLSYKTYMGLVDTGATMSCVTERVARELSLTPQGKITITSASHRDVEKSLYSVALIIAAEGRAPIPEKAEAQNLIAPISEPAIIPAGEFVNSGENDVDVLIGMDIIQRAVLIISGHDQRLTMSF